MLFFNSYAHLSRREIANQHIGGHMLSRTVVSIATAVTLASALTACGTPSNQTMGTVGGAALGGLAGSAVTGGSTVGTVGGAAVGGVIGHEVTKK
jgi:osmotically inducible lipoprotein OsmB